MFSTSNFIVPMPPAFPTEQLEGTITGGMLKIIQARAQADTGLVYSCILAHMATAVQELVNVKTFVDQIKPLSVFILGILETNNGKSTVEELISRTLREFEAEVNQSLDKRMVDDVDEDDDEEDDGKRRPKRRRWKFDVIYDDSSSSGLLEGLSKSSHSALHNSDEASGVLKQVKFADYCQLYGGGSKKIHRKGKAPLYLNAPRLTVFWQIQPDLFAEFFSRKGKQMIASGLLGRFLMLAPSSMQGTRTERPLATPPGQTPEEQRFMKRLRELLDTWPSFDPKKPPNEQPVKRALMTLDEDASALAWDFHLWAESELKVGSYYHDIRNFVGKAAENVCRVAAVLCYFETRQLVITARWLKIAIQIVHYYLAHAKAAFGDPLPHDKLVQDAERLHKWILDRIAMTAMDVPLGDIQRLAPADLRKSERLTPVLTHLLNNRKLQRIHRGRAVSFGLPPANWEMMQRAWLPPVSAGYITRI